MVSERALASVHSLKRDNTSTVFVFLNAFQVEVCGQAFHQEEIDATEDSEVSPRDVGHNIYILAYQVGFF